MKLTEYLTENNSAPWTFSTQTEGMRDGWERENQKSDAKYKNHENMIVTDSCAKKSLHIKINA